MLTITGQKDTFVCTPKMHECNTYTLTPNGWELQNKEVVKEPTMSNNTERDYLASRAREIKHVKDADLRSDFRIYDSEHPRTYKELIEWIKKGHYELNEKRCKRIDAQMEDGEEEVFYGYNCFDGIKWTGRPIDRDGFEKAQSSLFEAYQATRDIIMTQDATAGLEALKDFEKWSYTSKKK